MSGIIQSWERPDVPFGSVAALQTDISSMPAFGGKAVITRRHKKAQHKAGLSIFVSGSLMAFALGGSVMSAGCAGLGVRCSDSLKTGSLEIVRSAPSCPFLLITRPRSPPHSKSGWARQSVADLLNRMGGSIENEVVNFGMTGVVRNSVQRLVPRRVWLNHVAQLI